MANLACFFNLSINESIHQSIINLMKAATISTPNSAMNGMLPWRRATDLPLINHTSLFILMDHIQESVFFLNNSLKHMEKTVIEDEWIKKVVQYTGCA